ncbi:MAG: hypothetical protein ACREFY_08005, partial [Acetobacteraceae bacterium]
MHQSARRTDDRSPPSGRDASGRDTNGRGAGATVAWTLTVGVAALLIGLIWTSATRVVRGERVATEH